jgi:hypothetical protein
MVISTSLVPRLRAANDTAVPRRHDRVPAHDAPEAPLVVSFVGLTLSEQRAALAGFPGGRRFVLAAPSTSTA